MTVVAIADGSKWYLPKLNISVVERNTYYVILAWDLEDLNTTIQSYEVIAQDFDASYRATYEGITNIDIENRKSTVRLHQPDTRYSVCLLGYLSDEAAERLNVYTVHECTMTETIPLLQMTSIIALSVTCGLFVLLTVMGCFTWKVRQLIHESHTYVKAETRENGNAVHRSDDSACDLESFEV